MIMFGKTFLQETCLFRPTNEELENHEPEFTILCINDFEAIPEIDGTRTDVFHLN